MKVFIKTFGCSANLNNSEIMAGLLEEAGFELADDRKKADLVIVNTCIVKGRTEQKVRNYISEVKKQLVIAGCMPEVELKELKKIFPKAKLIGNNIRDIVEVVNKKTILKKKKQIKVGLPKKRKSSLIGIVQLSEGCLGNCSYCIVRLAKGKLFSYEQKKIIAEIKKEVDDGCREIWLTSQDSASYGLDRKTNLAYLLKEAVKIKGNFKIRLGMMNPNHVLPILDDLIKVYRSEKIFKFIHLPVQSGNDEILKRMNRKYKIADFRKIIANFRKEFPDISVSTDLIVGFPGETGEQFNDSLDLVREMKFDVLNISRFWPRPGTSAAKLPGQINGRITKERSQLLTRAFNETALKRNRIWLGWKGKIIIDEKGKGTNVVGRNFAYKQIVISKALPLATEVGVKVIKVKPHYLVGRVLEA